MSRSLEGRGASSDSWRIIGGEPLRGSVRPDGSKNGALPALAATLLLQGETTLHNVPRIADVEVMLELLRSFGLTISELTATALRITNRGLTGHVAPADLCGRMRASHYVLGPVALQMGRAELAMPGGCDLGARPVTHLLAPLEALGAETTVEEGRITVRAGKLRGAVITLDPQHRNPGATFVALMAASRAEGRTLIENASLEPDVVAFCHFLSKAGASIEGIGSDALTLTGVNSLHGAEHHINLDRLEAGTFLCGAAATRGEVMVEGVTRGELGSFVQKLAEAGVEVTETGPSGSAGVAARAPGRLRAVEVVTVRFPGFPTDLQPPFAAVLATADGVSTILESVYERRLQYADQLAKMGARVEVRNPRCLAITGVPELHGARLRGENIRDAAALVIAALSAKGVSTVSGRRFVRRGYSGFEEKLRSLGAEIEVTG
jgi:UDP-N-acetylglucosamine 1-carboxyvinyltransferase